ncbi:hypothetical protein BGX27_007275 [Mortierella sp. AM989]|nr:hypothetical protein BGX27_007275 [Mortierella sp. AM989]
MPEKTAVVHDNVKYRIRVSAGPDVKSLRPINVNDDANPLLIDSDEFAGHVMFRIKGQDQIHGYEQGQQQDGLAVLPDSSWFQNAAAAGKGNNLLMSMQLVGRFKREWSGEEIVLAVLFEKPFKLPAVASLAIKFFKAIDPALQIDVQCQEPYFISPLMTSMDTINVTKIASDESNGSGDKNTAHSGVPAWPSYNAESIPEDTSLVILEEDTKKKGKLEKNSGARKGHFAKSKNLSKHRFMKDHVYSVELCNPFLDCSKISLKLPGLFNIDLYKILNEQPITYAIKTQDGSATFVAVSLELVPVVEDLSTI